MEEDLLDIERRTRREKLEKLITEAEEAPPVKRSHRGSSLDSDNYEEFVLYREFSAFRNDVWNDFQAVIKKLDSGHECQTRIENTLEAHITEFRNAVNLLNGNIAQLNKEKADTVAEKIEEKKMSNALKTTIIVSITGTASAIVTYIVQKLVFP